MAKKGQVFEKYSAEFKLSAVRHYLEGAASYQAVAEQLKIRNCTQLKVWVKKFSEGETFNTRKGSERSSSPLTGRPRMTFGSIEEERDYLKVQVDYLKKRYPNLVKEKPSVNGITMK